MLPFNVGPWELMLIVLVLLLVFGAKRLPEMGAAMGKGIREFKNSIRDVKDSIDSPETTTSQPLSSLDSPPDVGGEPKKLSE